jgi:conjugal transfer/entry exclusion protein
MRTRVFWLTVSIVAITAPARAQLVVVDPGNLAQATLIAERTLREYETLWEQYQTIARMAQGLGNMDRYRLPSAPLTAHEPSRWQYGTPWLQGLNGGDLRGLLYKQTTRPLAVPGSLLQSLPQPARRVVETAYATIEITDAVAQIAGNQVALVRGYSGRLRQATEALQSDVVDPRSRYHELTALLDKVAAGTLIARRQDNAANQLLSHVLEQLLARGKRVRDTETAAMNMRLGSLREGRQAGATLITGSANSLRTWRQP